MKIKLNKLYSPLCFIILGLGFTLPSFPRIHFLDNDFGRILFFIILFAEIGILPIMILYKHEIEKYLIGKSLIDLLMLKLEPEMLVFIGIVILISINGVFVKVAFGLDWPRWVINIICTALVSSMWWAPTVLFLVINRKEN